MPSIVSSPGVLPATERLAAHNVAASAPAYDSRTMALLHRISQDRQGLAAPGSVAPPLTGGLAPGRWPAQQKLHALLGSAREVGSATGSAAGSLGQAGRLSSGHALGPGALGGMATHPFSEGFQGSSSKAAAVRTEGAVAGGASVGGPLAGGGAAGVVVRSPAEKLANPERLNLDRQSLSACPVLEGEERLRLLNYQNNSITRIEHLGGLPNLIFLDLYSNEISRIDGLQSVPTLRVLMLGKNHIQKVEGLEPLRKLDVLDLHSNKIERLQGISHLSSLRVLNLAGNCLDRLDADALRGLSSLIELNLRRNSLSSVPPLECTPSLQRLFLSSNSIADPNGLQHLGSAPSLVELALDGNPIALAVDYRFRVIGLCRSLRHLDLRRLSDEERARAGDAGGGKLVDPAPSVPARSEEGGQPARVPVGGAAALQPAGDNRSHTMRVAGQRWRLSMESEAGRSAATELRAEAPDGTCPWLVELADADRPALPAAKDQPVGLSVFGQPPEECLRAPVDGAASRLAWASFQYASIGWVLAEAVPRLAQASQLSELRLFHNNLSAPAQLLALRVLPQLKRLTVSDADNPAVHSTHFRSLVVVALPALETLNGQQVTDAERAAGTALWRRLNRLYGLVAQSLALSAPCAHQLACRGRAAPLQAGGGEDVAGAPSPGATAASHCHNGRRDREVVGSFVQRVVGHGLAVHEKMCRLNVLWSEIMRRYDEAVARELASTQALVRRYEAVVYGDGEHLLSIPARPDADAPTCRPAPGAV